MNMVQKSNLKIPNRSNGSWQIPHQLHETPEHTRVGGTHGPNPMREDFQGLHSEGEQMALSALLRVPFITWQVAEDASQIAPAWQMLTGFRHRSSTRPSRTIWLSHTGSQEALSNSCSANDALLIAGLWKGTSDAPFEGEPFRDGCGFRSSPSQTAQITSSTSSNGLGSIVRHVLNGWQFNGHRSCHFPAFLGLVYPGCQHPIETGASLKKADLQEELLAHVPACTKPFSPWAAPPLLTEMYRQGLGRGMVFLSRNHVGDGSR